MWEDDHTETLKFLPYGTKQNSVCHDHAKSLAFYGRGTRSLQKKFGVGWGVTGCWIILTVEFTDMQSLWCEG